MPISRLSTDSLVAWDGFCSFSYHLYYPSFSRTLHNGLILPPGTVVVCHKIQHIISTERNRWIYSSATLGCIGLTRNCMMMSFLPQKSICSDEPHFHLSTYGTKQICRIWGLENRHMVWQKPLHTWSCINKCSHVWLRLSDHSRLFFCILSSRYWCEWYLISGWCNLPHISCHNQFIDGRLISQNGDVSSCQEAVIWYSWIIFCKAPLKKSFMSTNQR